MNSEESSMSIPSLCTSRVWQLLEPLKRICCLWNCRKSMRRTTFMQSLRTSHQKTSIRSEVLRNLPIHNLDAMFLDGTPMTIPYVFDPTRRNQDYVFVKVDCLLPVFGGAMPSTTEGFSSIIELCFFVKNRVNLDECDNFNHASCPCHLMREDQELPDFAVKSPVDICEHQHFHHFCWKHIVSWLYNYVTLVILLQESKEHFDKEIAYLYSMFPEDVDYFQTGKRITPDFLFKTALNVDAAIYESDDEQ